MSLVDEIQYSNGNTYDVVEALSSTEARGAHANNKNIDVAVDSTVSARLCQVPSCKSTVGTQQ